MSTGTVFGVGLGPGDPDLMSVRAHRLVQSARHVAFFRKAGSKGRARQIVDGLLSGEAREHPMDYPVTTEIPLSDPAYNACLSAFYEASVAHLIDLAAGGEDVIVLCEGDPFFYGSFMHLYERLRGRVAVEVIPAITGMSGAWTATGHPVTWGDDIMTVLMATLPEEVLARRLADTDAAVVMKIGRNLPKLCKALRAAGMMDRAWLVQYATMAEQQVAPLAEVCDSDPPYFSIVVVHGRGRRP
jgi:precorrin-2/cobalt-factor-2 C20-methyltransferase